MSSRQANLRRRRGGGFIWEYRYNSANIRRWPNVGLLLSQRRRRWANNKSVVGPTLVYRWANIVDGGRTVNQSLAQRWFTGMGQILDGRPTVNQSLALRWFTGMGQILDGRPTVNQTLTQRWFTVEPTL